MENNRIKWIDIAKGYGMILVILGHCCYLGGTLHNLIFAFHMPLFFIMSAFFAPDNVGKAVKRVVVLIKQYLAFICAGLVITLIIPAWRNALSIKSVILDIYMLNPEEINVSSIWFLAALGVVIVMFVLIRKLPKIWMQIAAVLLLAVFGFVFAAYRSVWFSFLPADRLPGNLDAALVAVLFYAIGFYGKKFIFRIVDYLKEHLLLSIAVLIFGSAVFFVLVKLNGRVNLHGLSFNNVFIYLVAAVLGSLIFIILCSNIENTVLGKIGSCIGRNTVVILGLQAILVRLYIYIVNIIFGTEYTLYFLPANHAAISFVAVTFGICIPVCLLSDKIKEKKYAKSKHT